MTRTRLVPGPPEVTIGTCSSSLIATHAYLRLAILTLDVTGFGLITFLTVVQASRTGDRPVLSTREDKII